MPQFATPGIRFSVLLLILLLVVIPWVALRIYLPVKCFSNLYIPQNFGFGLNLGSRKKLKTIQFKFMLALIQILNKSPAIKMCFVSVMLQFPYHYPLSGCPLEKQGLKGYTLKTFCSDSFDSFFIELDCCLHPKGR